MPSRRATPSAKLPASRHHPVLEHPEHLAVTWPKHGLDHPRLKLGYPRSGRPMFGIGVSIELSPCPSLQGCRLKRRPPARRSTPSWCCWPGWSRSWLSRLVAPRWRGDVLTDVATAGADRWAPKGFGSFGGFGSRGHTLLKTRGPSMMAGADHLEDVREMVRAGGWCCAVASHQALSGMVERMVDGSGEPL